MAASHRSLAFLLGILLSLFCLSITNPVPSDNVVNPIILVPGDGGSQFEAKIDKPKVVHIWCKQKTEDWFSLWLNLEELAPYVMDCFVDNMKLVYDNKTRTTHNTPGVLTRQPGFGNTTSVEWLDSSQLSVTSYFHSIAEALVGVGYVRGKSLHGAPYDFRKAPNEMGQYFDDLTKLIEETYEMNGKKRVILVAHSMGNVNVLYLMNKKSQSWKDKHIKSHISLAGPWGGAAKTMRLMASGDNLNVFVVNPLSARPQQRSMPSSAWLMPSDKFWGKDEVLVYSPLKNYTAKDYAEFFKDISFEEGWMMRQDTQDLIYDLTPPGIEMHCLYGVNVTTPEKFIYTKSTWHDYQPDVIYGDGDGTVNLRSSLGCMRWNGKQKPSVSQKTFKGVTHMGILDDKNIIAYILQVVKS